ncbi:uncharacterized protein EV422DRAFT_602573 [Fimicolochytrium jonesii]|uniref:uncharacterized protein n=1 Tax=Fimicolochytrium jonesii TaxID=1396493 RepID=UPI0022FEB6A5|nr:uncharacterized protein EV422DRAFT_602573 [Fimicolochytrium jonesii]KAI8818416.1 hypothetical protein EV422DRAFT_602573 [Fimicolochytrium jonesii]
MPGSDRSSFTTGSQALSVPGSLGTVRGNGFLNRLEKKYKTPFFSLLVTLVKGGEHNVTALIMMIAEWLQLLDFAFDQFKWGAGIGKTWQNILSVLQFENLIIHSITWEVKRLKREKRDFVGRGEFGLIVLISVVLFLIALLIGLAYYVFRGFFQGSFKAGIGPVRLLRAGVSALRGFIRKKTSMVTVGFIPMYVPLLAVFNCRHTHEVMDDYPPCTSSINIVYMVLASIGIVILLPFTALATMTYFCPNSELFELLGKIVLSSALHFLVDYPVIRAILYFVFVTTLTSLVFIHLPYYNMKMNFLKFVLSFELMWSGACLLVVAARDNDVDGRSAMIAFFAGTPVVVGLGYLIIWLRWRSLQSIFPSASTSDDKGADEFVGKDLEHAGEKADPVAKRLSTVRFRWAHTVVCTTRFLSVDSTREEIHRAELLFRRGMELFPQDVELLISAAVFFTAYRGDSAMAIMLCQKALKLRPALDLEFTIFYLRRGGIIEAADGKTHLDLVDQLDVRHLTKRAKRYHDEAKRKIGLFWRQLLTSQPVPDKVRILNDLASQINRAERRGASTYEQLINRFPVGRHWIAYANFVEEVQNDTRRADELYTQYEAITEELNDDGEGRSSSGGGSSARLARRPSSVSGKITRIAPKTKKERIVAREYGRQIAALKSSALQRMGLINKFLIMVLIVAAIAEFIYLKQMTGIIAGKIDTVFQSGYRREAAVLIPRTMRAMQDSAQLANDTSFAEQAAALKGIISPLLGLQNDLFYNKMTDEQAFSPLEILLAEAHFELNLSSARPNDRTGSLCLDIFTRSYHAYVRFPGVAAYPGWMVLHYGQFRDNGNDETHEKIGSAFSEATYSYVASVVSYTRTLVFIQIVILSTVAFLVAFVGLFLFFPTMRKVQEERVKSLAAFTRIPRGVAETIYMRYGNLNGNGTGPDSGDEELDDSGDEDDQDEDLTQGDEIKSSHSQIQRRMQRKIAITLLALVAMFGGYFAGMQTTSKPLVDVTTRVNLAMRMRFGAMRVAYLLEEIIRGDYETFTNKASLVGTIMYDLSIQDQYRATLLTGTATSLVSVDSPLEPALRDQLFDTNLEHEGVSYSLVDALFVLREMTSSTLSRTTTQNVTHADPEFQRSLATAMLVQQGMLNAGQRLREVFNDYADRAHQVAGAILGTMLVVFLYVYFRVLRKLVKMLNRDQRSTQKLLLMIPPQIAIDLEIISSIADMEKQSALKRFMDRVWYKQASAEGKEADEPPKGPNSRHSPPENRTIEKTRSLSDIGSLPTQRNGRAADLALVAAEVGQHNGFSDIKPKPRVARNRGSSFSGTKSPAMILLSGHAEEHPDDSADDSVMDSPVLLRSEVSGDFNHRSSRRRSSSKLARSASATLPTSSDMTGGTEKERQPEFLTRSPDEESGPVLDPFTGAEISEAEIRPPSRSAMRSTPTGGLRKSQSWARHEM